MVNIKCWASTLTSCFSFWHYASPPWISIATIGRLTSIASFIRYFASGQESSEAFTFFCHWSFFILSPPAFCSRFLNLRDKLPLQQWAYTCGFHELTLICYTFLVTLCILHSEGSLRPTRNAFVCPEARK